MDYPIAFSPELNLSVDDFSAAWNADPRMRALGAAIARPRGGLPTFLDPLTTMLLIGAMTGVSVNVLSSAVYDFLKQKFGRETTPQIIQRPDQTTVIVIIIKSE